MTRLFHKLQKLKRMGLDELAVRGSQAWTAQCERLGLSEQASLPSDAALFRRMDSARADGSRAAECRLDQFRNRRSSAFFAGFADREETVAQLRRRFGSRAEDRVIERACRIMQGEFDLLGLRGLHFNDPIDWHLEPITGSRAPKVHWSRLDELDSSATGDKKVLWELGRHWHFMTLGRAYWLTGEESYARTFAAHLDGWMEQNPPKLGVHWVSSLEIAFRAISWLWAFALFAESAHLTPALFVRALKYLYLFGRHLETYLSTYSSPNTHLTGEALGLFYLGVLLPEFRCARRWRTIGQRILLTELSRHIREDGVYFEQSTYYQKYTTDFYLHFYILAAVNGIPCASLVKETLAAMLDHHLFITRPDGTTPFFGDDDGGRLVHLDERAPNDFRAALSTGAALFGCADYKYVAGEFAEETLWLLGSAGARAFDRIEAMPPTQTSRAFPIGGYYVMRDGWTRDANYLLLDCGPHGALNCGHAHADALAFDLAARGRTLLVDPGTYTYTGSAERRDAFRSSAAHNTLMVDGESSSLPGGPFAWKQAARASLRDWQSCERLDFCEGEHDGYNRLPSPVVHQRSILFLKGDYWIIRDRLKTEGAHACDLYLHFVPEAEPCVTANSVHERGETAFGLEVFTFGQGGGWRRETGWVSRCYGERTAAPVVRFSQQAEGVQELVTFLVPRGRGDGQVEAREIEADGGRAFEMGDNDRHDLLLLGDGAPVHARGIASDFEWVWARFTEDSRLPQEMALINGHSLDLHERQVFASAERVGCLLLVRSGDTLVIKSRLPEFAGQTDSAAQAKGKLCVASTA